MDPVDRQQLRQSVQHAATRPEVRQAVDRLYEQVQHQIDQRRPVCQMSGRCCRFEEYGHRLFVTTIELAAFLSELPASFSLPTADCPLPTASWDGTGCPFQQGKLCGVHGIRPFGCRMFFCDGSAEQWQNERYEQFHAKLKRLHEELGVPYFYVEWRAALRALGWGDGAR